MDLKKLSEAVAERQSARKTEKPRGQQILEKAGYEFDDEGNIVVDLSTESGKNFGKIPYNYYKTIETGKIGSLNPTDKYKSVIDAYKEWIGYDKTYFDVKASYDQDKFGKGNIDLTNRPVYANSDGSISTVRSMSISEDGKEILIPTVVKDRFGKAKILADEEAIKHYHITGEHLGKFDTVEEANDYAHMLSLNQSIYYDYVVNSQYKSTANGKETKHSNIDGRITESAFDDVLHDYINGNEKAEGEMLVNNTFDNVQTFGGFDKAYLKELYPDEVAYYNYIYNKQGKDKAREYLDYITSELYIRQRNNRAIKNAEYAKAHPIHSSAWSIVSSPLKSLSAIGQITDYVKDGKIDQNAPYNKHVHDSQVIRNTVSSDINQRLGGGFAGGTGSFLYQTGMSMGDSAMNTATSGGNKYMSLTMMGSGAFADTVVSSKDRGLSDDQAIGLGSVAGIAEIFTESFSWNKLMSFKNIGKASGKNAITSTRKYIIDNMKTNALEELGAEAINFTADVVISKDKSQWQESINNYIKEGKNESEAWALAFRDTAVQFALATTAGAISGGSMAGPSSIYINSYIKKTGKENSGNVDKVIAEGLTYAQNTEAYNNAVKLSKTEANISDYQLGRQVLLNYVQSTENIIAEGLSCDKNSEAYKNAVKLRKGKIEITAETLQHQINLNNAEKTRVDISNIDNDTKTDKQITSPETGSIKDVIPNSQRNTFTDELDEITSVEMPTVGVGDTFVDSSTNESFKIIERDSTTTTIEKTTTDGKKAIQKFPNKTADKMTVNDRYSKLETSVGNGMVADNTKAHIETISPQEVESVKVGDVFEANGKTFTITGIANGKITYTIADENGNVTTKQADSDVANMNFRNVDIFKKIKDGNVATNSNVGTDTIIDKSHTVAYTNDNQKIEMVFKILSVDDLIVSNELDGSINNNYPQELQPRDRNRIASKNQIRQMANDLNPERLAESTSVSEGAPIVGPDNVVESGNGRTLAIKLAYEIGSADEYRDYVINNANEYGIDVSNIPEKPILVRERLTEVDRVEFVRKANESTISSMSATEQSKVDAENLSNDILNLLVANDDGNLRSSENKDFVSAVVTRVFKNEDLNNVVNAEGNLSARGLERITNAIFYKAYGDASLSARLSESLDNDMKNATKVLLNIAPKVVSIKNDIQQGELYNFDFSGDIASAVRLFEKCRSQNKTVSEYSSQTSLFEKESSLVYAMAYIFETKNRGAKQATEFYNLLLDTVEGMGSPNQISLGITEVFQTKEEIFDEAVKRFNNGEESTKPITIPEGVYRSEREPRGNDDGQRIDEVSWGDTTRSEESGTSTGIQQDNGRGKETRIVADDEQLRQENEGFEGQAEVSENEAIEVETKLYNEIVDEVATDHSTDGKKGKHFYVAKHTPDIIVKKADIEDLPIIISFETLYLAVRESGELEGHYHNIGADNTKKLYEVLSNPTYILKNNKNGRINIISDITIGKHKKSVVSIELDVYKNVEGNDVAKHKGNYNLVITLFSAKDNYSENLKNGKDITVLYKKQEDTSGSDLTAENVPLGNTEEVSSEYIVSHDDDNVKGVASTQSVMENNGLTDKCTLTATKRTDNGKDIWVIGINDRISKEEFNELRNLVKKHGGSYSRFAKSPDGKSIPGFIFNSEPTDDIIKVFNDFFDYSEENTVDDSTKPQKVINKTTESSEKEAVYVADKSKGTRVIARFVSGKLAKGEKISSLELSKIANVAFGGTMADNAYSIKDAYDAMELGVNQYILSLKDVSAEKMLETLELLPTQTKRTEEMVKFQQFSTPPSIAYLANYTANVNENDIMLEPSAGIGGIAVFAKKDGAKVYVNELDNRRLDVLKNMPFDGFYNEDAEQIDNILGGELEPTVIVMNPPFSSSSERNIHNTKIGGKHIEQALKILAPNGRLVAIVGKGMADGEPAFRNWWKDIKAEYNVRANIGINGKNYNKYGTNFDIQMLVIDKNGPTTDTVTGHVDTLQELQEKLGGIRDERPAIDYSGNEQRTPTTTREETTRTGESYDRRNSTVPDTSSGTDNRKSTDAKRTSEKSNSQDIQSTDGEHRQSDSVKSEGADVVVNENRGVRIGQSDRLAGEENTTRTDDGDSRQSDVQTRRTEPRKRVKKELTDSIFEQYQPQELRVKNAQPHPARVSESAAMSAIEPPPITYTPNIPQDIIDKGVVSAVQLEAISYAGQSHSQTLPNGTTRGFFLGDGTGIGKGRTIAGMMLDNYNQGRKKAVWVTLNSSLVNDAKRDVKALFGNSDLVTQFVGGNKADGILNTDEAILVVSYSALAKGFDNKDSNFEKIVNWLGKDFDGLIVFDEAHKMGNATATKGTRGVKKASQTGIAGISLQEALPKAKVVYSSATGATEVENLRYAERLGLWGEGTPFLKGDDFVSKVKAGGLAAMELIARDMKAMGVYLSRNISYDDVQYDKITHKLTAQQTKIYDELASSWQIVLQNINKALEQTNQDKDGHARGRVLGAFWSSQQRFFNQILTSMQVPSVISDIEKQLADGKSCVIQLVSTNEAAQNQEFERLKSEDLELDEFDLTPKQVLMSLIENSFPVQQFEEYRDDNGNVRSRPVYDSKGKTVINRDAVRQRDELLDKLGSIKVPSSPIDMIINHFGTDLVAENTGRARRVIQKDGKPFEEKIGAKKDADVEAFQNGNKRIIIFSKAGGTGKSYHADKTAKNQQQRVHYLLEAGWQADNAVQGFGRSHRSNQVSAPIFKLVTTNLKGQMRFISTIAKRLDQLGAMTKGQRQAGGQGMFSASDNLENSFAADVLAGYYKDLVLNRVDGIDDGIEILEKLGLKNKILDEYGRIIPTASELREVNKFLNRILSLESAEQNTVFEGYSQRLQDATEKAMQAGTLDKGLENYKADKITLNEVQDIREDERSGAKTKYYNLTAEHKIKPVKFENVPTELKSFVGFYQNKNTGAVRAVFQTSSTTDKYGNVSNNYKLTGQVKNEYIPQHRLYGNWTELKIEEAEKLWNEELSNLPEYRQENLHLISGVVLPVWDKLPTENVRIYRVLTSDGEMLIGRVVGEDMIDETLRRLGSSRTKEKIATNDLITHIKNGDKVHLENDWILVSRKVSGENRIEIIGPSYEHHDMLMGKGVFAERIQYRTRYFIPANTNTEQIIDEILKISPVMRVETEMYSIESEELSDDGRSSLLSGNRDRASNASARKQTKRISDFKQKIEGKTKAERRSFAKELLEQGNTKEITDEKHQFNVVNESAYNEDMLSIVEEAKKMGLDVGFFVGSGKFRFSDLKIDAIEQGNKILLRYDGTRSPQSLFEHEKAHTERNNPEMQKAKNIILNNLSDSERKKILAEERYKNYMDLYKNDVDKVLEEFVADVFAGMNEYTSDYIDLVVDYWYEDKVIDKYNVSEYTESIDTGDNTTIVNNIGISDNLSLTEEDDTIYLNAVENGDMETAQKIVDEKAVDSGVDVDMNGKPIPLYHGTSSFGFTRIDTEHSDDKLTFWATTELEVASSYNGHNVFTDKTNNVREIGKRENIQQKPKLDHLTDSAEKIVEVAKAVVPELKDATIEIRSEKELLKEARKDIVSARKTAKKLIKADLLTERSEKAVDAFITATNKADYRSILKTASECVSIFTDMANDEGVLDDFSDQIDEVYTVLNSPIVVDGDAWLTQWITNKYNALVGERGVYRMYYKVSNPYIIDCKGVAWNQIKKPAEIDFDSDKMNTRQIARWAFEKGYDSVKFENTIDMGSRKAEKVTASVWCFMRPESQLWSADPVTYDDNGNVIPVSERYSQKNELRYSISIDDDIAELTPERTEEILDQFDRDRVEVKKPNLIESFGERAEWIAHNMTRVFPEIPERGERGTFFAEFRKMMIQWKALPKTSMFMAQDKLNQMTKDLTPAEFKTFSELVYFLDLQEEAQLQKERGFDEILLPNKITPREVDQIVEVINKEATPNVKKALKKRRQIWDELKEQYITLNQYIGFDTDGKFNRKNYYHHQVIEYMNKGGKGVAKGKDIEIKAGRGWLKERQGSTKAINTDFLAVEYKAMLQMQYDIYVANMLGKIKDQYDIKPQLEKQAFTNNKKLLNDIIAKESTDEDGKIILDNKGKPDSETYRQQQWYNQRIMFGFSGLFDLAEAGLLPTFNGQYGNVIRALQSQRLNVPGLYNYVGEIASMNLSEEATDEETQAQISARTVLKYTSQKKAWVKEVLGNSYQTWETLANDMKDTHSIHQPRRGNYFYTKDIINEDAFNKAFNDMIVSLVSGENGVDTNTELKKLFGQYSETIRLIGAAYEQWVIPNEIETVMNKVANPKQVNAVSQLSRSILSAWKGWATSVNPLRTVKFFKRNLFGDLDAVIAGKPQVVRYSKRAVTEIFQAMKNKKYTPDFMEWIERGGYSSLIFANEMDTEMQDKLFTHLKDKEGINIFKIPANLFKGYYNGVENAHNFREAILRYSSYLYFKDSIIKNGGKVKDNVASNRYIVKGLQSIEDKAYQLSKDLLGAYDEVGAMGQALRRHAIPFYSFTETNLKRYYRMFENIIMADDTIPKKAGKLLLKGLMVNMLTLLMVAWNRLVMKDEDDELPPSVRNIPHITLGKFGDDVYAFRQLGSFSEILEWFGLEDYKWTEEDKTAPIDKLVGMISPVYKTPVELLTGLNSYPSITQPRAIRDKWEYFFSTLGVDDVYRVATGKPSKGAGDIAVGAITYRYDYKESAYYEILDIKREYQKATDNTIYGPTPKSNALYYMKTAIRYKDKDAALKYLDEYFENGGTAKGIVQSIEMLNPMYGYTGKDTFKKGQEFINSLSDDEKEKLRIAQDYYENDLMLPPKVSTRLRKKDITEEEAKNVLRNYINAKCK